MNPPLRMYALSRDVAAYSYFSHGRVCCASYFGTQHIPPRFYIASSRDWAGDICSTNDVDQCALSILLVTFPGGWGTLLSCGLLHTPGIRPFAAVVGLTFLAESCLVEALEHLKTLAFRKFCRLAQIFVATITKSFK